MRRLLALALLVTTLAAPVAPAEEAERPCYVWWNEPPWWECCDVEITTWVADACIRRAPWLRGEPVVLP